MTILLYQVSLVVIFACSICSCQLRGDNDDIDVHEWTKITNLYKSYAFPLKEPLAQIVHQITNESSLQLSHNCKLDLTSFADQLDIGTTDAMSILDSFSTRKAGSTSGLIIDFGSWQVCQSVQFNGSPGKQSLILPKLPLKMHATLSNLPAKRSPIWSKDQIRWITFFNYAKMPLAICLPSTCSESDVTKILNSYSLTKESDPIAFELMQPYTNFTWPYRLAKLGAKVTLLVIFALNIFGTLFKSKLNDPTFLAFDLQRNLKSLMRENNSCFKFISLIKVFYLISATVLHLIIPIMYFQTYFTAKPFGNNVEDNLYFRLSLAITMTTISLNFVIASTLVTLSLVPILKKVQVTSSSIIVHRALRTLPVVFFTTLVVITLPDLNFNSPFAQLAFANASGTCFEHSWAEVTFVSNFRPLSSMCNRVAWFISADMQLFVAFLPLLFYLKNNYTQRQFNRSLLIFIFVTSGYISYLVKADEINETFRNLIVEPKKFLLNPESFVQLYFSSFNYVSSYAAGMLIGYEILNGFIVEREKFAKILCTIFILLISCLIIPLIALNYFIHLRWLIVISMATVNLLFGSGLILLFLLLNSLQDDSTVKSISGHLSVQVASRLSFCFFLVHPFVIVFVYSFLEIHFTNYIQMFMVTLPWVLIIGGLVATAVHLFVELPIARIVSRVVSRTKNHSE